ncbi:MAG: 2Fe-2S iron-sulfur cluster-binding protein, partial [Desulfitobacterium hafniense]|nr:2Fe-2S iron-sulfur cluster-binding protein [Desulfitobacterium hafniense]
MALYTVKFMPENRSIDVEAGTSLLKAASMAGIPIKSGCGGKGSCGACKVLVMTGKPQITGFGSLSSELVSKGWTLACKTIVTEGLTIEIPPESRLKEHQVLVDGSKKGILSEHNSTVFSNYLIQPLVQKVKLQLSPPSLTDNTGDWTRLHLELRKVFDNKPIEISLPVLQDLPGILRESSWDISVTLADLKDKLVVTRVEPDNNLDPFGLAIDIGTTTVVVSLVNLNTGETVASQGTYNKQARYGDDVISRIVYASESL